MSYLLIEETMCELVIRATDNFTKILSTNEIFDKYKTLSWGRNGLGSRWAQKKFNYTVIYSKKRNPTKPYSENDDDEIPPEILNQFLQTNNGAGTGIIGIFVHSIRTNNQQRPIRTTIHKKITSSQCVLCGTHNDIICDHKNDLYNDERVLSLDTQLLEDFQPLCCHCNLQKRQICKTEKQNEKLFSAKNMPTCEFLQFEFPWEKKVFDKNDINCKNSTYWFDPVEFHKKIDCYRKYVIPIITAIKLKYKIKN